MKRRQFIKLIKKSGYKYCGKWRSFIHDLNKIKCTTISNVAVFTSKTSEFHIAKRKSSYIVTDMLNGKTCKDYIEVLMFMKECDKKTEEWVKYQIKNNEDNDFNEKNNASKILNLGDYYTLSE